MSELVSTPSQIPITPEPLITKRSRLVSMLASRFTLLRASNPRNQVVSSAINAPGTMTSASSSTNCVMTLRRSIDRVGECGRGSNVGGLGGLVVARLGSRDAADLAIGLGLSIQAGQGA